MNINNQEIKNMTVDDVIGFLVNEDDYLIMNTNPESKIEKIRNELVIQYNKLTNSNVPLNHEV